MPLADLQAKTAQAESMIREGFRRAMDSGNWATPSTPAATYEYFRSQVLSRNSDARGFMPAGYEVPQDLIIYAPGLLDNTPFTLTAEETAANAHYAEQDVLSTLNANAIKANPALKRYLDQGYDLNSAKLLLAAGLDPEGYSGAANRAKIQLEADRSAEAANAYTNPNVLRPGDDGISRGVTVYTPSPIASSSSSSSSSSYDTDLLRAVQYARTQGWFSAASAAQSDAELVQWLGAPGNANAAPWIQASKATAAPLASVGSGPPILTTSTLPASAQRASTAAAATVSFGATEIIIAALLVFLYLWLHGKGAF